MTSQQLLLEGVDLMLVGMGLVFLFLILLIFFIRSMAFVLDRFAPEQIPTTAPVSSPQTATAAIEPDTLQAIKIAIKQHRAPRG